MAWTNTHQTSHRGGEHVRASHTMPWHPLFTLCPLSLFPQMTSPDSPVSNGSLPVFFKNKPHVSKPCHSSFPTSSLMTSAFLSPPPPHFHLVSWPYFCPHCTLPFPPCPLWGGCDGSDWLLFWEGKSLLCGYLLSIVLTTTGNHLRAPPPIPTSIAEVKGFH